MTTPLSIQRTKLLLSRPKIFESLAGTTSMLTAGELQKNKRGVDTAIILFGQCPHYLCYIFS